MKVPPSYPEKPTQSRAGVPAAPRPVTMPEPCHGPSLAPAANPATIRGAPAKVRRRRGRGRRHNRAAQGPTAASTPAPDARLTAAQLTRLQAPPAPYGVTPAPYRAPSAPCGAMRAPCGVTQLPNVAHVERTQAPLPQREPRGLCPQLEPLSTECQLPPVPRPRSFPRQPMAVRQLNIFPAEPNKLVPITGNAERASRRAAPPARGGATARAAPSARRGRAPEETEAYPAPLARGAQINRTARTAPPAHAPSARQIPDIHDVDDVETGLAHVTVMLSIASHMIEQGESGWLAVIAPLTAIMKALQA